MQIYSFGLVLICIERPDLMDSNDRFHGTLVENLIVFYGGNGVCLRQDDIQY